MSIQVGSSIHAAATLFVLEEDKAQQFLQSPQGCILQRVPVDDGRANGWLFLLDYGLDAASTAFSCAAFGTVEPNTSPFPTPFVPLLFHIDDRVKALVNTAFVDGSWQIVNQSFHALFVNYQANQQELYPVDIGQFPELLRRQPPTPQ